MADPDFDRIFAEGGAIDTIVDADYDGGWDDIAGASPPTKAEFNSLQNESDLKSKYLFDRLASRENLLHNGAMEVNQEAASYSGSSDKYSLDGWWFGDGLGDNSTISQGGTTLAGVVGRFNKIMFVSVTDSAISASAGICQLRADLNKISGETVTFSIYARGNVGVGGTSLNKYVSLQVIRLLKTDSLNLGNIEVIATENTADLTAAWTRYAITVDVPFDADREDYYYGVAIRYAADGQVAGENISITGAQLEFGYVATDFDITEFGDELVTAKRTYQTSYPYGSYAGDVGFNGCPSNTAQSASRIGGILFDGEMTSTPTVTIYSPDGTSGGTQKIDGSGSITGWTAAFVGAGGIGRLEGTGATAGSVYRYNYVADSRIT